MKAGPLHDRPQSSQGNQDEMLPDRLIRNKENKAF